MPESTFRKLNLAFLAAAAGHAVTALVFLIRLDGKANQAISRLDQVSAQIASVQGKVQELEVRITRLESQRPVATEWHDRSAGNPR